ncbi:hypothetical protein [Thiomicrorhabdus sp. Kp2]|uniref:hypothetical protein n=1 Tax=Thiomicrorhabdus sp. Kp2 TaxID=1123518 RepID=UPI0004073AEF|nr:hypothetical protein [Thiomicrorhabdus sp. Kp2]
MKTPDHLTKQKGAISLLGASVIALGLVSFEQILQYGNAKILDRELDNYARTVASVALRSELAITKAGIDAGTIASNQTDIVVDSLLSKVEMYAAATDDKSVNINKEITFGNLDSAGNFVALSSNASNPRGATTPPDFSAVAVQLWSTDSFMGIYTPQGKAIYTLSFADQNADSDCYCKNRYTACLDMDLTVADLAPIPAGQAALIAVKGSDARKEYCNYGYTAPHPSNLNTSKYPWAQFDDGWIGREPNTSNFFMFYSQGYSDAAFSKILEHKPLAIDDGEDPLYKTGGMFSAMKDMMFSFMPWGSSDEKFAYEQDESTFKKDEISPSSAVSDYRCLDTFFMMSSVKSCGSVSSSKKVVLDDSFYIGYKGTCLPSTSSAKISMGRCLSYNDGGTPRYESCLDIERRSAMHMNFFQRMMSFFFGPILNWERAYEGLDCEMKKMKYVGWMFWGGWKEV